MSGQGQGAHDSINAHVTNFTGWKSFDSPYMHQLLDLAIPTFDEIFQEVDVSGLVDSKGIIYIWNNKDLSSRELEINIRKELGIEQKILSSLVRRAIKCSKVHRSMLREEFFI